MQRSVDGIVTTHTGSLPRPDSLLELDQMKRNGEPYDELAHASVLKSAVKDVVTDQLEVGLDSVNDGEFGKAMRARVDYGAWASYVWERLAGTEVLPAGAAEPDTSHVKHLIDRPHSSRERRERKHFRSFYEDDLMPAMNPGVPAGAALSMPQAWFTGPVSYAGHLLLQRDIDSLRSAAAATEAQEVFMTSISPESCSRGRNTFYASDEELLYAVGEALREEYKAIIEAGFVLQIDDPGLAENWDNMPESVSLEEYRRYAVMTVEALNYALRDLPEERIRYHICWGSWHGPHLTDLPLADIVDVMLRVKAGGYIVEAGNVRHEHEWSLWRDIDLPESKVLLPGVVSHATNVIEHPELVAYRIMQYASVVGRERVIPATDCGLGGRIHPTLAWAKLNALVEGARLATTELWSR